WPTIGEPMRGDQRADCGIGLLGRGIDATGCRLVNFDREKKIVAVTAPAQGILAAAADWLDAAPDFKTVTLDGFEADADEARIIGVAVCFTKPDHSEDSGLRQQIADGAIHVTHLQRWQGVDRGSGCRFDQSHGGCGVAVAGLAIADDTLRGPNPLTSG